MPSASVTWIQGTQLVGSSGSGHALVLDTPVQRGGGGSGASPMELLLMAQAGCTAIDVVHILKDKMRRPVTGIEVQVDGDRAEEVPKVYTQVKVTYRIRGKALDEKDVQRAVRLSAEKYCSVSVMMAKTAALELHYEIVDEAGGEPVTGKLEPEDEATQ